MFEPHPKYAYELNHDYKNAAEIYLKANKEERANLMFADYYYEKGETLSAAKYLSGSVI